MVVVGVVVYGCIGVVFFIVVRFRVWIDFFVVVIVVVYLVVVVVVYVVIIEFL